jgi:ADP-ribose pyrophosphatase
MPARAVDVRDAVSNPPPRLDHSLCLLLFTLPMPDAMTNTTVFSTAWFDVVAKSSGGGDPYYSLRLLDYVTTIGLTSRQEFILVRQHRPAVERSTLELPAGHVEAGESPADAARRELEEETGFTSSRVELLGKLTPDTGRLSNALWCFLAVDAVPITPPQPAESGIEVVLCSPSDLCTKIRSGEFDHALHLAALHLALMAGKLPKLALSDAIV